MAVEDVVLMHGIGGSMTNNDWLGFMKSFTSYDSSVLFFL